MTSVMKHNTSSQAWVSDDVPIHTTVLSVGIWNRRGVAGEGVVLYISHDVTCFYHMKLHIIGVIQLLRISLYYTHM